jgi:hypothetical protein
MAVVALAAGGFVMSASRAGADSPPRGATHDRAERAQELAAACSAPPARTDVELAAIRAKVEQAVGVRQVAMIGTAQSAVALMLWPGEERRADRLLLRYGNDVEITIAGDRYCGVTAISHRCPRLTGATPPLGVHLRLRMDSTKLSGRSAVEGASNGELTVSNDGPNPFRGNRYQGQPIQASVVKRGSRTVVGLYRGIVMGTGQVINLAAGQSVKIPVIVSAWRCDGRRGTRLPPGRYGARAGIASETGPPYLAPEAPIRVTR